VAEDKNFLGVAKLKKGTNFHTGFLANQKGNVIFLCGILWGACLPNFLCAPQPPCFAAAVFSNILSENPSFYLLCHR